MARISCSCMFVCAQTLCMAFFMKKIPESKELNRQKDYATNKMLAVFCLAILMIISVVMFSRYRASMINFMRGKTVLIVAMSVFGAGILFGLGMHLKQRGKSESYRILNGVNIMVVFSAWLLIALAFLVTYETLYALLMFTAFYMLIPIFAVLYMVYFAYQRQFFYITALCAFTGFGLWAIANVMELNPAWPVLGIIMSAIMLAFGVFLAVAKRRSAMAKLFGIHTKSGLISLLVTCATMIAVTILAICLGSIIYYFLFAVFGYLLVFAVYYTVTLM